MNGGTVYDFKRILESRDRLPSPEERKRLREDAKVTAKTMAAFLGMSVGAFYALEKSPNPRGKYLVAYVTLLDAMKPKEPVRPQPEPDTGETDEMMQEWAASICGSCGGLHATAIKAPGSCPRIRRAVYDNKGQITEVEYWPDGKWPKDGIWWPPSTMEENEPGGAAD